MKISRIDWFLVFLAVLATLIGIVTIYGASQEGASLALRKSILLLICLGFMFALAFTNYQSLGSYAPFIYLAAIVLLILTLIPFIGAEVKGARAWIRFGGFSFQPAEFAKLALVVALAKYLVLRENEIGKPNELIFPLAITAVPMVLITIQPDLGSAALLIPILFTMLFIGGANISVIVGLSIVGLVTFTVPMFLEYKKYMLVDDIQMLLQDSNYRLSEAVRTLNFEMWHYMQNVRGVTELENAETGKNWAITAMTKPENRQLLSQTVEVAREKNPSLLRDYLSNEFQVLMTILVSSVAYGVGALGYFMTRKNALRLTATVSLIITLSLLSSFVFRTVASFKPHQVIRVVSFANPDKFPRGAGYQLRQSLTSIGSGQVTGKGFSQSDMTRGDVPFLPEWNNDFIFAPLGEQFGFGGCLITLIVLFAIISRAYNIALQSKDDYGALLASGIATMFFFHVTINVGIAVGLLPVTGIPLIFLSSGGSNMLISFMSLGILLNINMRRFINL